MKSLHAYSLEIEQTSICIPGSEALNMQSIKVRDALIFRNMKQIDGCINLTAAKVGNLVDAQESWELATQLKLDGFTYEKFAGNKTKTDSATRLKWLAQNKTGEETFPPPAPHPTC